MELRRHSSPSQLTLGPEIEDSKLLVLRVDGVLLGVCAGQSQQSLGQVQSDTLSVQYSSDELLAETRVERSA